MRTALFALAFVLGSAAVARAHKPSDSYLTLRRDGPQLTAQWDIALRDLDQAIGLDGDGDGAITWGEVRARQSAIDAYALARLHITADGSACAARPPAHLVDRHSDGAYAVLRFALGCAAAPRRLAIDYRLFFDFDPQHRGVLRLGAGGDTRTILFTADQPAQPIAVERARAWPALADFWCDGVRQICGFNLVLFLLALLMPSVVRRESASWHAVGIGESFAGTLKVVMAFTVAHSITLSLAALGTMTAPARWIGAGVAVSPVVAALSTVYRPFANGRSVIAFAFGLLHGFGFAGAFADSGVPYGTSTAALLGFNVGLESGQIAIVGLLLALAHLVRSRWLPQRRCDAVPEKLPVQSFLPSRSASPR